jgi:hypothetical protein
VTEWWRAVQPGHKGHSSQHGRREDSEPVLSGRSLDD